LIGKLLRNRVFTISEEDLCFTEDEIDNYFSQLSLSVTGLNVRNIYEDTQGWAFAVNLIGRSLCKDTKYERCALDAMKANAFRLIESEIADNVSDSLWRFLLRISLVDHLAAGLIRDLAEDEAQIKEMEALNAFIRYDMSLDTYMMHHLLLDYLRQHQHILSDEERRQTCRIAGKWCDAHGYHMDALSYYEKSCDYGAVAEKVGAFNVQMPPDMAQYALEIFENAPDEAKFHNPLFPGMHIKTRVNFGRFDEDTVALAHRYADYYERQPDSPEKNRALTAIYVNWVFLSLYMCTYTDKYDFYIYQKRMVDCYLKNPFEIIGKYNLTPFIAWASLVGTSRAGAQEEYIEAMAMLIPIASELGNGFFIGCDDLARGELCFYRGQFSDAAKHLLKSVQKAQKFDQYVTFSRALSYLMRIAFFRGDLTAATEKLKSMQPLLNDNDYGVRYAIYDIAYAFYLMTLGQAEQIPQWLKDDFSPYAHPAFLENYANRIKMQYHFFSGKYSAILAFTESESTKNTLFGKIELKLVKALVLYKLKRRDEAISALTDAYALSASNDLAVIFTQFSKDMRTLTAAALRDDKCDIPRPWLENINRKASAYAKRQAHLIAEYMRANNIEKEITLTDRETKILKDLSHGLSRSEIAASQNLSINTVKMVINIIYDKLCVTSLPDAIRVAVDWKIV